MRSTKCYPAVFLGHSLGEVVVFGKVSRDIGLPEALEIVESLGQSVGAGNVDDLDGRVIAVEAVHVALLLAGERGRRRGWRLRRGRGHDETGADLRSDSAGAGSSWTEVTIQCPDKEGNVRTVSCEKIFHP